MMSVDLASSARPAKSPEDAPVEHASWSSASSGTDKAFAISAANILQTLVCLNSLIRAGEQDPGKLRVYANLVEEKLQALGELMRPMLWCPAGEKGHAP